jgi:CRP/FNR family cyclic AMP-dependent transcriptional regulator
MLRMTTIDPTMLKNTTLFSALTEEQSARLVAAGEVTQHESGEMLTEEGTVGHRFRLIIEGAADVERAGRTIARLGRGDFIGEVSLLGGGPALATVRCTQPTSCLTIWREAFWTVLEEEPAIALRILEVVCRRLEQEFRAGPTANLSV